MELSTFGAMPSDGDLFVGWRTADFGKRTTDNKTQATHIVLGSKGTIGSWVTPQAIQTPPTSTDNITWMAESQDREKNRYDPGIFALGMNDGIAGHNSQPLPYNVTRRASDPMWQRELMKQSLVGLAPT